MKGKWLRAFVVVMFVVLVSQEAKPQRSGIVVSADTKLPVRDVAIRWDNKDAVKSSWNGTFVIPREFNMVNFHHPKYETRMLRHDEVSDTIYLLPSSRMLSEVVIYGERRRRPDYVGINSTDKELIAVNVSGGANVLGIIKLLAQPIINKIHRDKTLKKARKKQVIDNY